MSDPAKKSVGSVAASRLVRCSSFIESKVDTGLGSFRESVRDLKYVGSDPEIVDEMNVLIGESEPTTTRNGTLFVVKEKKVPSSGAVPEEVKGGMGGLIHGTTELPHHVRGDIGTRDSFRRAEVADIVGSKVCTTGVTKSSTTKESTCQVVLIEDSVMDILHQFLLFGKGEEARKLLGREGFKVLDGMVNHCETLDEFKASILTNVQSTHRRR